MRQTDSFFDLRVWQQSMDLMVDCYALARRLPPEERFGMASQLQRASLSIPSNIAEGSQRGSDRDSVRFFYFARGSAAELATQLEIANAVGLLEACRTAKMAVECEKIGAMLIRLIKSRCSI